MKICKIPWAGFSNDPDGTVRPCCIYRGHIQTPSGSNFYVQNDDIKDIFHSEYMNDLRNQFLNGEMPKGCETCWIDESNGYKSKREIYNEIFNSTNLKIGTDVVNEYPIDYQIIISNACNLKCRSCGTSHSTEWQKEINNLPKIVKGKNDYVHKFTMPFGQPGNDNGKFINNIIKLGSSLKRLEIVGGEPFFIDKWETVLDAFIDNGFSSNIELAMSTNATIFNEKLLKKIVDNFMAVGIGLSVDGMGKTYEYLRKNGKWDETKLNCIKYYDFLKGCNKSGVSFNYTYTISWISAFLLPEFHDWVKEFTPNLKIWNNIVHYPPHMSVIALPNNEKERIETKWLKYDWGQYKNDIHSILNFMWSKSYSDDELKELYKNFIYFDNVRKEKTLDVVINNFPSIKKYFNE